jgi:hypothetical protein
MRIIADLETILDNSIIDVPHIVPLHDPTLGYDFYRNGVGNLGRHALLWVFRRLAILAWSENRRTAPSSRTSPTPASVHRQRRGSGSTRLRHLHAATPAMGSAPYWIISQFVFRLAPYMSIERC